MISYITFKKYVLRALLAFVASLVVLYAFDYLVVRYRAAYNHSGGPFGSVDVYTAVTMKNGSVQLYYRLPQAVTCVHSVFPHLGYTPCWYLSYSTVKMI